MKRVIKSWIPPAILNAYRGFRSDDIRFQGHFLTWESARAASSGYDDEAIFRKSRAAALKVKKGEVAYERDSVLFDHVEFSYPLLAGLLRAACARGGNVRVLDIGGSFGTTYRQFKAFLTPSASVRWNIVEQPRFVESGQAEFADEELNFFRTIEEAAGAEAPDVVLLSSVMQYVDHPYDLIREICSIGARSIVIARTPCAMAEQDLLTVQVVPPSIYEASYPCWIFAEAKLLEAFSAQYRLVASFQESGGSLQSDQGPFELRGFILDRKSSSRC
ncbi:MAG: methyltransferase, TIGR04325 family [Nitrospira sp.]|nr:methyltransferase, TIGR04325 family [Nitrospira sp.]